MTSQGNCKRRMTGLSQMTWVGALIALAATPAALAGGEASNDSSSPPPEWSLVSAPFLKGSSPFTYLVSVKDIDTVLRVDRYHPEPDPQSTIDLVVCRSSENGNLRQIGYEDMKKTFEFTGIAAATTGVYLDEYKFHDGRATTDRRRDAPFCALHAVTVTKPLAGAKAIYGKPRAAGALNEGKATIQYGASRTKREELSALLEPDILKDLPPAQRTAYDAGKNVILPISSMPAARAKSATRYIADLHADIMATTQGIGNMDLSRLQDCSLVLNKRWGRMGVDAFCKDGSGLHF